MRVMLAGDWHGNLDWATVTFDAAAASACPVILQLGDFGLWPGREEQWLDQVEDLARTREVSLTWVDGNHEHHDWLEGLGRGLVQLRPHVTWASRGSRWAWSGVRFGALGGAVSVDRFLRRPGVNWWPQEMVSQSDVERLGEEPLDVLATHASPMQLGPRLRLPESIGRDVRTVSDLVAEAARRTGARLVVHGHHHVRHSSETGSYRVEGLARDGQPGSWAVLDLEKGSVPAVRTPSVPGPPPRSPASAASREHSSLSGESARG